MTSLRGPGERNFNAVSHKPKSAPIQFNSICSRQLWFMGYTALKFLSSGPRSDVTDHLVVVVVVLFCFVFFMTNHKSVMRAVNNYTAPNSHDAEMTSVTHIVLSSNRNSLTSLDPTSWIRQGSHQDCKCNKKAGNQTAGISFGSIFLLFSFESSRGPRP